MLKVQEQKHGAGEKTFDFLNEPSRKPAAMQADEDLGFDEMQMSILEDTEQVRNYLIWFNTAYVVLTLFTASHFILYLISE